MAEVEQVLQQPQAQQPQAQQLQQLQQPQQPELPHMFCVKTHMGEREGYFLMRWSLGNMVNNEVVHILKPTPHHGRFYNIEFIPLAQQNNNLFRISTRKNAGLLHSVNG